MYIQAMIIIKLNVIKLKHILAAWEGGSQHFLVVGTLSIKK